VTESPGAYERSEKPRGVRRASCGLGRSVSLRRVRHREVALAVPQDRPAAEDSLGEPSREPVLEPVRGGPLGRRNSKPVP
jgi:hypothetical protein